MIVYMPIRESSNEDLAYAAGIIDGEGSIGIYRRRNRRTMHTFVRVSMCEPDAVQLLHEMFAGSVNLKPRPRKGRPNHRLQYEWSVAAQLAAACLQRVLPYLRVKRRQAINVLELQTITNTIREQTRLQRAQRVGTFGPAKRGQFNIDPKALESADRLYEEQKKLNARGKVA